MANKHSEIEKPLCFTQAEEMSRYGEMISDQMAEILRRKTDAQRLRSVDAFWNSARAILKAAIRTEHPEWNLAQVHAEVARRLRQGDQP